MLKLLLDRDSEAALAIVNGLRRLFADEDANDPAGRDLVGSGDESMFGWKAQRRRGVVDSMAVSKRPEMERARTGAEEVGRLLLVNVDGHRMLSRGEEQLVFESSCNPR